MRIRSLQQTTEETRATPLRGVSKVPLGLAAATALAAAALSAPLAVARSAGAATASQVSTTTNSHYGTILVSGTTLYTLKPSKVRCDAACLKVWPQMILPQGVTSAKAGPGVNAAKLGTVTLKGGALQVTYGGKPLYWFFLDTAPGQVKGNIKDKWGAWSVVVTAKPSGSHASSGSNSSSGSAGSGGVSF